MARPIQTEPTTPEREVVSATIDLATLDTIVRPRDGTGYVMFELEGTLLRDVRLWLDEVRFEFAVVDPVLGTVEPRGGSIRRSSWPFPLVRTVLDRVGIGLLEADR